MCNHLCKQLTIVLVAILIAHLWPKKSHWRLTGHAKPNSFVRWSPDPGNKEGMMHFHFFGDGTIQWGHTKLAIENHTFFHLYGSMPEIKYFSDKSSVKVEAHLFV